LLVNELHVAFEQAANPEYIRPTALVQSWPEITRLARAERTAAEPAQAALL
jgi:hypothetical protein